MEDMKHAKCADCKHWDRDEEARNDYHRLEFGKCTAITAIRSDVIHERGIKDRLAIAVCYSRGIEGELLTKPEFSCRLFEHS